MSRPWSCALDPVQRRALGQLGHDQHRREVQALRLPVPDGLAGVEQLGVADGLVDRAEAQLGEVARAPARRGTRRR